MVNILGHSPRFSTGFILSPFANDCWRLDILGTSEPSSGYNLENDGIMSRFSEYGTTTKGM